jgi:preprotein translocase subunit SecF
MFNIVEKRHWFFLLSAVIIIPGLVAIIYSSATIGAPLKLSIDFTGGALLELRFDMPVLPAEIRAALTEKGFAGSTVQTTVDDQTILARTKPMQQEDKTTIMQSLREQYGAIEELRF